MALGGYPPKCRRTSNFRFKKLTVQDGLSQSAISSVIQDQLGFLWIGTRDGLNRYDGYNFKQYYYQPNDSSSLPHSTIHHLSLSPDQQLWLATPGYICQYQGGSEGFVSYPIVFQGQSDKTLKVNRFFWKNNHEVLLATTQGLVLFNLKTKKCSVPKKHDSFRGQDILSVFLNAHSYNWVASNTGIYRAPTSNASQWQRLLPSEQKSTYLTQTSTQRIFASVDQQLFIWDTTQQKFRLIREVAGNQPILEIKELANKQLWVAWGNVTIFSPEGKYLDEITHEPNNPFSISQDVVNNVYESQDGIIWLGTNGFGLNKLDPKLARFGYIGAFPETKITLSHMYTQAIYTPNDTLLYITVSEGLNQINFTRQTSQTFNNRKSRRSNQFNCIMPNSSGGEIWLGSNDGLWKFKKGQFISVRYPVKI
mgnify:CR=1 FL=1